ncbi:MAG: hypothetical protein ACLP3C_18050 [Mycobacterium sp.]|uniref:hypothetical protein n=1 Tax=Mycobacterium sp. TaxID=1785 RepID=UPI003F982512
MLVLGVGGLRWGEAAALRVCDVNFLRRRIELHCNAVQVGTKIVVGTLKSIENRAVVLPKFVIDALAQTASGKGRDDLFWSTASGGYMGRPGQRSPGCPVRLGDAESPIPHSPRHGSRAAAHGSLAGDQRWGEPEGVPADVGARERSDDPGR